MVRIVPFAVSVHNVVYVVNWVAPEVVELVAWETAALVGPVPCGAVPVWLAVEEALVKALEPVKDTAVEVNGAE